jgi:hypothetical protein
MKIKLKFFDWFEDMLKSLVDRAQSKKKKTKKFDNSSHLMNHEGSQDNGILSSLVLGAQDPPSMSATNDHQHHHH